MKPHHAINPQYNWGGGLTNNSAAIAAPEINSNYTSGAAKHKLMCGAWLRTKIWLQNAGGKGLGAKARQRRGLLYLGTRLGANRAGGKGLVAKGCWQNAGRQKLSNEDAGHTLPGGKRQGGKRLVARSCGKRLLAKALQRRRWQYPTWVQKAESKRLVTNGLWQKAGGKSATTEMLAIPYLVAKGKAQTAGCKRLGAKGWRQKLDNGGAGNTPLVGERQGATSLQQKAGGKSSATERLIIPYLGAKAGDKGLGAKGCGLQRRGLRYLWDICNPMVRTPIQPEGFMFGQLSIRRAWKNAYNVSTALDSPSPHRCGEGPQTGWPYHALQLYHARSGTDTTLHQTTT